MSNLYVLRVLQVSVCEEFAHTHTHTQSQMHDLKQSQSSESSQLHSLMVDPAVNVMFSSMKRQLKEYKEKLEQAQNDLTAWKFTPDR